MKARKKFSNIVKLIDIFGQPVNFTLDGHSSFNSIRGSVLSLLILALVTFQITKKYTNLVTREDTKFSQRIEYE